ncbi:MAG TPA: nucleotide exchange factor GrpE [Blastocatellia bacterium]|nr:nucleotide exchange factor GrpE [Blastocatellia bacterium]
MKQLRARRFGQVNLPDPTPEVLDTADEPGSKGEHGSETDQDGPQCQSLKHFARAELRDEASDESQEDDSPEYESQGDEIQEDDSQEGDSPEYESQEDLDRFAGPALSTLQDLGYIIEEASQEIRKIGRELFKSNKASEHNARLFEATISELRQVTLSLRGTRQAPDELVFQAKAALCRDLFPCLDVIEASIGGAKEILSRCKETSAPSAKGIRAWLARWTRPGADLAGVGPALVQWIEGQQLLLERLMAVLNSAGVVAIESSGKPFDPEFHRAIAIERNNGIPSGTIISQERKGYTLDGRILRYAEVVVAKNE